MPRFPLADEKTGPDLVQLAGLSGSADAEESVSSPTWYDVVQQSEAEKAR